jgi:hypothetical protein
MAKERTAFVCQHKSKLSASRGTRYAGLLGCLSFRAGRKYLEPAPQPPGESGGWEEKIDWDYVRQEVYAKGTTVKQIGQEVVPEIAYVKFWRVFGEKTHGEASADQVTMRLDHKARRKNPGGFLEKQAPDACKKNDPNTSHILRRIISIGAKIRGPLQKGRYGPIHGTSPITSR